MLLTQLHFKLSTGAQLLLMECKLHFQQTQDIPFCSVLKTFVIITLLAVSLLRKTEDSSLSWQDCHLHFINFLHIPFSWLVQLHFGKSCYYDQLNFKRELSNRLRVWINCATVSPLREKCDNNRCHDTCKKTGWPCSDKYNNTTAKLRVDCFCCEWLKRQCFVGFDVVASL